VSISQIKKQFEEMSTYLGRDVTGLEKLRKLKDSVNELRTQLTASTQARENAESRTELIFAESTRAKTELSEARREIHSLRQRADNIARELELATDVEESLEDDAGMVDGHLTRDQRQYRAVIKELRKQLPYCPLSVVRMASNRTRYYDRDALSKGWSHQALWALGASVAILAAFEGDVGIVSNDKVVELEPAVRGTANRNHQTVQWLRKITVDEPIVDSPALAAARERANLVVLRNKGMDSRKKFNP